MSDEEPTVGRVEAIFTAPEGGAPMERRDRVRVDEAGIEGDRYRAGTGTYSRHDPCVVTFVAGEALDRVREEAGIDVSSGEHRRNVVVRGVDPESLLSVTFRVGGAEFRGTRRRPPCAHVEDLAGEEGLASALTDRGGVCAEVLAPGAIEAGDTLAVVENHPRKVGAAIADRLREDGE